jgi:hypothetical protein
MLAVLEPLAVVLLTAALLTAFTQGCEKHGIAIQNTMPLSAAGYTARRSRLVAYYGW